MFSLEYIDPNTSDILFKIKFAQMSLMLDSSVDCIKLIDLDGRLLQMNKPGCLALGVPVDETKFGMKWLELLPKDVHPRGRRALAAARKGKKASFSGRSEIPGCPPVHWDNILTPMRHPDGTMAAILCVSRDITRQREAEQKLRIASNIDMLTGLPNRRYFRLHIEAALKKLSKTGGRIGLVMADVDRFKEINDRLGHDAGDFMLRKIGKIFQTHVKPGEFAAWLGGDEFVFVTKLKSGDPDELSDFMMRIAGMAAKPINYKGKSLQPSFSMGGAVSSDKLPNISSLMKACDAMLYEVKLGGRNGFKIYHPTISSKPVKGVHSSAPAGF